MKKLIILILILFLGLYLNAQILDLSNAKNERKVVPIKYDSSYIVPNYSTTKEMLAGLVGQKITILDISDMHVKDTNGNYASYYDVENIDEKTWIIKEFINEGYDGKYKISNENKEWIIELSSTDKWYINAGFDVLRKKLIGKSYVSFKKGLKIKSIDDSEFILDGSSLIKITDLQYAKLSSYNYGIVIFFDNGLIIEYDSDFQPDDDGWIAIGGQYSEDILLEDTALKSFTASNLKYIDQMREGKVAIGMTEDQTRLAWGMPTKSYSNIAGYDKVNSYGEFGHSQDLYFIGGILKLIK